MSIHLTQELLEAWERGEIPLAVLLQIQHDHVQSLCPHCRRELEAWRRSKEARSASQGRLLLFPGQAREDYSGAFARLRERVAAEEPEVKRRREVAEAWLQELLPLPQDERKRRIDRARTRFRGGIFAQCLLVASRAVRGHNTEESYALAECAQAVLYKSLPGDQGPSVLAQALALMGNARRAVGDLEAADRLFDAARGVVERQGVTDLLACAELERLEGSLRRDQRRYGEAEILLTRAALLYGLVDETVGKAEALLKLSDVYSLQGVTDDAIGTAWIVLGETNPAATPVLYLGAKYNLALYLYEAGRHVEALEQLIEGEFQFEEHADRWLKLRVRWLHGLLKPHMGQESEAEKILLDVRDAFAERPLDQAHVGLDLAMLFLRQGRLAEVKRVAEEAVVLFEAQAVHQEALAALILFRQAAEREAVNEELVRKLANFLEEAARDPKARFEPAS